MEIDHRPHKKKVAKDIIMRLIVEGPMTEELQERINQIRQKHKNKEFVVVIKEN